MTKKIRRHYTPQEKIAILKQHLLEGRPVSNLCDLAAGDVLGIERRMAIMIPICGSIMSSVQ